MSNPGDGIIDDLFFGGSLPSNTQHPPQHPSQHPLQHPSQHPPQHPPQHQPVNQPIGQQMSSQQMSSPQIQQPYSQVRSQPGRATLRTTPSQQTQPVRTPRSSHGQMQMSQMQFQSPPHISPNPMPHSMMRSMNYSNISSGQPYPMYSNGKYQQSPMSQQPQHNVNISPLPTPPTNQPQSKTKIPKKALKTDLVAKENEEDINDQFDVIRIANVRPEEQYGFDDDVVESAPLSQQQIDQNNLRDQESFVVNKMHLARKVRMLARDMNIDVDSKVIDVMQVALQERVKDLLERLVDISKLRIDTHKDTLNFCISSNPRRYLSEVLKREKEEREKREQQEREQKLENKDEKTNKGIRDIENKQIMGSISNAMGGIIRPKNIMPMEPKMTTLPKRDYGVINPKQEFQSAKERSRKISREDVLHLIQHDPILRCSKYLNEDRIMSLSLFYSSASNIQQRGVN